MRICFLTRDYALTPPFGGVATYVRDAAQWLASEGHDVQVVCVNRQRAPHVVEDGAVTVHFVGPRRIKPRRVLRMGARLPGLSGLMEAYSGWGLLENSLGGWAMVSKLARSAPFDLVECDDFEGLAFWGLWPVHRYRVILRGHGIIHLDLPFTEYPGARFHHSLERVCAEKADFVLTAAQYLVDAYREELGIQHSRIASLPLPFDVRGACDEGADAPRAGERVIALYVGRLEHRKGTDLLLDALERVHRQCTEMECVLVGNPVEEFAHQLEAFVQSNSDWVTFAGALPQDQVFRHMTGADMLLLPSRTETLPRVLIEAQAYGLPQVATRVGGIPEVVEEGATGLLVDGDDASGLAQAILKLCRDEGLRLSMAAASVDRALARYDRDKIMAQQLKLYQVMVSGEVPEHIPGLGWDR